ncbi:hypothetical protein DFQ01_109137 [Paenibacillus cellulosilyticus]|uniref:Uncharacterized protein n=1 Tax=Paenibacillus cellulosilyticus TaxID=375489 RepID=A0A2V2YT58_9BACL|nr:hypothetical protein DFQ01_109137 [Paenibacillus cellulosilyticus]
MGIFVGISLIVLKASVVHCSIQINIFMPNRNYSITSCKKKK